MVTLMGLSVTGVSSPPMKKQKSSRSSAITPPLSLGTLALAMPQIPKSHVRQVLDEYRCTDEQFVCNMVGDLKSIELDRIKVVSNTPQQNRQYVREAMMKVSLSFL